MIYSGSWQWKMLLFLREPSQDYKLEDYITTIVIFIRDSIIL